MPSREVWEERLRNVVTDTPNGVPHDEALRQAMHEFREVQKLSDQISTDSDLQQMERLRLYLRTVEARLINTHNALSSFIILIEGQEQRV